MFNVDAIARELQTTNKLLASVEKKLAILLELQMLQVKLAAAIEDPHVILSTAQKRMAEINSK